MWCPGCAFWGVVSCRCSCRAFASCALGELQHTDSRVCRSGASLLSVQLRALGLVGLYLRVEKIYDRASTLWALTVLGVASFIVGCALAYCASGRDLCD